MHCIPKSRCLHILLLLAVAIVFAAGVFCSCSRNNGLSSKPLHKVVVIHSWDSIGEEGKFFQDVMAREFAERGVNAQVYHFYGNMLHRPPRVFADQDWPKMREKIEAIQPDVILLNDDPIVETMLSGMLKDSIMLNTPIVFAGVNTLQRDSLKHYPLITGYEERIDIVKNLEVISYVTKQHVAVIELDEERADSVLRKQLYNILSDSVRYINNSDFHLDDSSIDWMTKEFPGKTVVHFISAGYPYKNHKPEMSDSVGKENLQKAYKHSKDIPQLQVKYDIFSNSVIDRSRRPQFTCIREQFNSDRRLRFLAGYFTSTELQVIDQVQYATRIISGENPQSLPLTNHRCDYFMDWTAMCAYAPPLRYGEFSSGSLPFHIINAPFELEYPLQLAVCILLVIAFVIAVASIVVHYLTMWKNKGQKELIEDLTYEEKIHDLIFSEINDTVWRIHNDEFTVEERFAEHFNLPTNIFSFDFLERFIHPDSMPAFNVLKNYRNVRGRKVLRMKLTPDFGNTWYWVEVAFTMTDEFAERDELYGLLLNIDHKKKMEEELEQAQILSSEVALKENFLANISHDLKTPLGAVTGFSELLTMPGMEMSDEERAEYSSYIHQNTEMILSMIDDVMHKAQTEDADLEIIQKPVELGKLINDCYQTNRILAPSNIDFNLVMAEPDCNVNIDLIRTKQVINNFLSNAFKFTFDGSITLGWRYVQGPEHGYDDESDTGNESMEWVEVFVKDTGIGMDAEGKAKIFDRYVKVNETDRGTGLGLNISKTIVEKQGGTIGVESELGEGSTFFFRLRKYVQCLLLIISIAVSGLSVTSCMQIRPPKLKANVVVIHSYDKQYYAYNQFNEELRLNLVRQGIDPTIRHMYLDLDNTQLTSAEESYRTVVDSLKRKNWKAGIILTEGDRAASYILNKPDDSLKVSTRNTPIVFGALHHPEWERIRMRPNIVAINDPIDYVANLNLATKLSGMNAVEIELDYFPIDSLIRTELRQAINRPPFVDNTDHHIKNLRHELFNTVYKDSIVVLCYSAESPERNSYDEYEDLEFGYRRLGTLFTHSWLYPSLSLKKDVYSTEIVDKTGKPQFTAVNAGFADGEARYLCGYFADYSTVAKDLAHAGASLLKGTKPTDLTGLTHRKNYYMDYAAMKALGLKYSDYKDQFIIVGAPTEETAPLAYYGTWALSSIVFIVAILALMLIAKSWKERSINDIMKNVKRRATMRHMALNGADSRSVRSEEALSEIIESIHPDHSEKLPLIKQAIDLVGTHFYEIYADVDKTGDYNWWQLRFAVMYDKKGKHVDGILYNIEADKRREAEMRQAIELAEEAKQKEDFLTTISHELRTPLNAVVGFSDVMATLPRDQITDEELEHYGKIIKSNNNVIRGMIEDILMFSRIESHRLKYVNKEFFVKDLIDELVEEWKPLMPPNVNLHAFCLEPEVVMNNDRARIKYILNQLMSNSVKFTQKGMILLGSMYHHNEGEVEFVVADTGCGMPRDKLSVMFGLFWKDNEFVPGLGLGLHIANKLAEGMNLRIKVDTTEGYGTKMLVSGKAELRMDLVDRSGSQSPQLDTSDQPVL